MADGKYFRLICVLACSTLAMAAADDGKSGAAAGTVAAPETGAATRPRPAIPPVLRKLEPDDSRFVLLPGLAPAAVSVPKPVPAVAPIAAHAKAFTPPPAPTASASLGPAPPPLKDPGRPVLRRSPKPLYPEAFEADSGAFCQKEIGHWTETEAIELLGTPFSKRSAYDDKQGVNGRIYAFDDPTNRYKQLELDFDSETGALRTVFVYPWKMTWQECRRLWGTNVSAAEANKGRKFYSYLNRRLDVLVDATGNVISLGLY